MEEMNKGNVLEHHGILGMKWGKQNGPPYPLDSSDHSTSEKKAGWRKSLNDKNTNSKKKKRHNDNSDDIEKSRNPIERHKEKLIQQYLDKGLSAEAAETAAKQRMRAEAVVAGVATVTVAAIATKAAVRIGQEYVDKTIKSGVVIQNINANSEADFSKMPFYAAINKHDKKAYASLYPSEKRMMVFHKTSSFPDIYKNDVEVTKPIKRASVKNARDIFTDLMNNDADFKQQVSETLNKTAYREGLHQFKETGTVNKKLYDSFNQALATPEFQDSNLHTKYYDALTKKGYGAILDINDTRYSGYKNISKSPTIFFNENLKKIGATKINDVDISKNAEKYTKQYLAKEGGKRIAKLMATYGVLKEVSDTEKINDYLQNHPNSKKNRKEILEEMKSSKKNRK